MNEIEIASTLLKSLKISPNQAEKVGIKQKKDGQKRTAFDLLGQSHDNINKLINLFPDIARIKLKILFQLSNIAKYEVYISRQKVETEEFKKYESKNTQRH